MLDEETLARSSVVANNAMNRERGLTGPNSYSKDLGVDVEALLDTGSAWLDLCCGSGRALVEAAALFGDRVRIVGLDLVDFFVDAAGPELITGSVATWRPDGTFDLITCVHGLHYVGDKLGAITRAVSWLRPDGRFVANFDAADVRDADGVPLRRSLTSALRKAGIDYDARKRRLSCVGPRSVVLPFDYLGADDQAGPNYTGQPAVVSHYGRRS
jgi:SAM-dependent methyltransferase